MRNMGICKRVKNTRAQCRCEERRGYEWNAFSAFSTQNDTKHVGAHELSAAVHSKREELFRCHRDEFLHFFFRDATLRCGTLSFFFSLEFSALIHLE